MKYDETVNGFTVDIIRITPENDTAKKCTFKPDSELHGRFKIKQSRLALEAEHLIPALNKAGWIAIGHKIVLRGSDNPRIEFPFKSPEGLMGLTQAANMHDKQNDIASETHTYLIHAGHQRLQFGKFKAVYAEGTKLAAILRDICTDYTDCPENASEIAIRHDPYPDEKTNDPMPNP